METWNMRLAKALAESDYNKNSLASALGVAAPTVSAWVGAAGITPSKNITAENLLRVCEKLGVRPEWVLFRSGEMRRRTQWPFGFSIENFLLLPESDRQEIEEIIELKFKRHQRQQIAHQSASQPGSALVEGGSSSLEEAIRTAQDLTGGRSAASNGRKIKRS